MSFHSTNPFARNSRATARPPYTFGPQANSYPRSPTHPFPVNHIRRAPGHAPNPFQQHTAPLPNPLPLHRRRPINPQPPLHPDAVYARAQATAHTCACPYRLYANHAQLCTGPTHPTASMTPLGRLGNAGSAVTSIPPLVWFLAAVAALSRAVLLRIGGALAGVAAALGALLEWVVGEAAPVVGELVVVLLGLALLSVVVWWSVTTAANVWVWAVTWKRPAEYYTLRKGFQFLGNVSPLQSGGVVEPVAVAAPVVETGVQQMVEAVKSAASFAVPRGMTDADITPAMDMRSTFSLGPVPPSVGAPPYCISVRYSSSDTSVYVCAPEMPIAGRPTFGVFQLHER